MKTALITGCSTGIGEAAAKKFAAEGWSVAATMRNPENARFGDLPNIKVFRLDVTDRASIAETVAGARAAFGGIDVLVNNAGYGLFGPFETASDEAIQRQFQTNLFGLFDVTRAVLPGMREAHSGVVVNVASIGGLVVFPLNALYSATKFALVGFSQSINFELEPFGVRVKVVAPGGVATDFAQRSLGMTFTGDGAPYADSIAKVAAAFRSRTRAYSTSEQIAEVIFAAATDGSRKMIYVAGEDAVALAGARAKMSDEEFLALMEERMGLA